MIIQGYCMKQVGHSNTISRLVAIHLIASDCNQACSDSQLLIATFRGNSNEKTVQISSLHAKSLVCQTEVPLLYPFPTTLYQVGCQDPICTTDHQTGWSPDGKFTTSFNLQPVAFV
jgi:hypothetical protein